MSGQTAGLAVAVFLACAVEAVEALTIVLAVGLERGWRSALWGAGTALLVLSAVVGVLGPSVSAIPLGALRVIVGGLLLVFGLGWLRKAILRASGHTALHDETEIYARQVVLARAAGTADARAPIDRYAFTIAFKAVLLEGLEVAFIVVTFGAAQHNVPIAAAAALLAILIVVGGGLTLRAPLSRVPENTLKLCVGVMLCAFGTFWAAEGAGAHWPGGDAALLVLIPALAATALTMVAALRTGPGGQQA